MESILSANAEMIDAPQLTEEKEAKKESPKKKSPKKKGKEEKKEVSVPTAVTEDDILKRTLSGNMYKFEGVDYSETAKKEDENVLQDILKAATKEGDQESMDLGTPGKRSLRKRNISAISPASQISSEELAEQKRRKKEERIQKLREKSGYISSVMSPSSVDWETINAELEKAEQRVAQMTDNIDLHSSNREDLLDIVCLTGFYSFM